MSERGVDRSGPPAPGPVQPYRFPGFERRRLEGGIEVIGVRMAEAPVVALSLLLPAGGDRDPVGAAGTATLVASLLDEGTECRGAMEIASSIESLGGRLETTTDWNVAVLGARLLSPNLEAGLALVTEIATRPTFPPEEVERVRRNRLTDLLRRRDRPGTLAIDHLYASIYRDGVYGRPLVGTPDSVRPLERDDLVDFYRLHYRMDGVSLLAVGDLEPDRLVELAAEHLAGGAPGRAPEAPTVEPPRHRRIGVRVVDRPGASQTELRVGQAAVSRNHPDWTALGVLNVLFGGKFTSRINLSLRERHGLTYGAASRFVPRRGPGPFVVQAAVDTAGTGQAAHEILRELHRLQREPVAEEELADAKSYALGIFPYQLQTVEDILDHLENLVIYDLPDDHYAPEAFVERLQAVDRDEVQRVAREHLRPDEMSVVAVGPAAELVPQLEDLGELEVVRPEGTETPDAAGADEEDGMDDGGPISDG